MFLKNYHQLSSLMFFLLSTRAISIALLAVVRNSITYNIPRFSLIVYRNVNTFVFHSFLSPFFLAAQIDHASYSFADLHDFFKLLRVRKASPRETSLDVCNVSRERKAVKREPFSIGWTSFPMRIWLYEKYARQRCATNSTIDLTILSSAR